MQFRSDIEQFTSFMQMTPGLMDYYHTCRDIEDIEEVIKGYRDLLSSQEALDSTLDLQLKILLERYHLIKARTNGLSHFNEYEQLDDYSVLKRYDLDFHYLDGMMWPSADDDKLLSRYIESAHHPFVCAELCGAFLQSNNVNGATVFLQEVLVNALNTVNPYWNNRLALIGCAEGLNLLITLLDDDSIREIESLTSVNLCDVARLHLLRGIEACNSLNRTPTFVSAKRQWMVDALHVLERRFHLLPVDSNRLSSTLYKVYSTGHCSIPISVVKELLQYIRDTNSGRFNATFGDYISERTRIIKEQTMLLPPSWKKEYSELDQRLMEFFIKKDNYQQFIEYLDKMGVEYMYHLTLRSNVESIIQEKGLYSWEYRKEHGLTVDSAIGTDETRRIDEEQGRANYVRLSFCSDYPSEKIRKVNGEDLVLLKIKRDVLWSRDTLFSDRNAVDPDHHYGAELIDLQRVNIPATQKHSIEIDDPDYDLHQAEAMVKEYVPLNYIINIDNPETY